MGNASQCNESDKNRPELSQKPNFFFSKEFLIDKEAGRAYSSFSRRDVAQSGSALEWGSRGRRFKSFHPDQKTGTPRDLRKRGSLFCFWGICFFLSGVFCRSFRRVKGNLAGRDLLASLSPTAGNRYRASAALYAIPTGKKATETGSAAFLPIMERTRTGGWPPSR